MAIPLVGDIVLYNAGLEEGWVPAIITHVWSDVTVNLRVVPDAAKELPHKTSAIYGQGVGNWRWREK